MSDDIFGGGARKEWTSTLPVKSIDFGFASIADPTARQAIAASLKIAGVTQLQPSRLALVVHVIIGKASKVDKATIWVSLENSVISSGKLSVDEDHKKGWFQDRIEVEMSLVDAAGRVVDGFQRTADGPQTVNGSGATSSSVSLSFSASGNFGFFGGTPTGGAGVGVGASESHSFAKNLQDFKCVNSSNDRVIKHVYKMSSSSGGSYNAPGDLVPSGDAISFTAAFQPIKLYTPPDLATANLELLSQAVWQATSIQDVADLRLRILVTQHVVMVEGRNDFVLVRNEYHSMSPVYEHIEPLPMSSLAGRTAVAI